MQPFLAVVATIAVSLIPLAASAEILNVGDPAPPLTVSQWIKGEKFEGFEPGKVYVVEFWATWCGPCIGSIPHLTELAHQYQDQGVRFVGVDVFEQEPQRVQPFVEKMADKMDYAVALDAVDKGAAPAEGAMAKAWMDAAEESGIPTAFVIRDSKIAWIGHPMSLDEPLAKIVAGPWDFAAGARERLVQKATERRETEIRKKVLTPYRDRDYKATVAAIDEVMRDEPEVAKQFESIKFIALGRMGQTDAALDLGNQLFEANRDKAGFLNNTFWDVVDPGIDPPPDPRLAQLALKAARRAVELTKGEDASNLDTLAEALYITGDVKAAIATEERALELLAAESDDEPNSERELLTKNLERFRKAAR